MPARTLISVEEYLRTSYRPDCDYVDGEVVGRNMGEWDHSRLQGKLLVYLARYEKAGCIAVPEQRVQVGAARFRIPDICLVLGEPGEKILTKPPFLCIEVLSPEDRLSRVMVRVKRVMAIGQDQLAAIRGCRHWPARLTKQIRCCRPLRAIVESRHSFWLA